MPEITRIESLDQLDELFAASEHRPVWIFKHSLACPVSRSAWGEYRRFVEGRGGSDEGIYAVIEIQSARPVSNAVAERTGVRHESPQVLLVDGGEVAWHESHFSITARALSAAHPPRPR